jgi:uncharacterized protein
MYKMSDSETVEKTRAFIEQKFKGEGSGHDYWHILRVWKLAKRIAAQEKDVDLLVVELGAFLHDIADWKFHDDPEAGSKATRAWLESIEVEEKIIAQVEDIVRNVSYKGAHVKNQLSREGQIIWDADKLDALGAIGIARCFAFGGSANHVMYDPAEKPTLHTSFEEYKKMKGSSVTHFYEKLLLLKDKMYTDTGKQLAEHRHEYMENYLKEFYAEWEGKI